MFVLPSSSTTTKKEYDFMCISTHQDTVVTFIIFQHFGVAFPMGLDSATFWDKGTEVLSLSWDKGITRQAKNLAKEL